MTSLPPAYRRGRRARSRGAGGRGARRVLGAVDEGRAVTQSSQYAEPVHLVVHRDGALPAHHDWLANSNHTSPLVPDVEEQSPAWRRHGGTVPGELRERMQLGGGRGPETAGPRRRAASCTQPSGAFGDPDPNRSLSGPPSSASRSLTGASPRRLDRHHQKSRRCERCQHRLRLRLRQRAR